MNSVENKKQIIKDLLERGKKKGMLSYKEIMDTLEEIELDPEQIEKVYENIENLGIEITGDIEEELEELKLEEEEIDLTIPEGIALDDPVRMYLKEIGKVALLTPRRNGPFPAHVGGRCGSKKAAGGGKLGLLYS
jgi:RNA polymerase primary sigma factor